MEKIIAKCKHESNSNLLIPLSIAKSYHLEMNNKDIRHQNFLELLKGYKSQRAFADRCNLSPGFVSQINNRTRNIGDAVAADIETALGLPHGWMDQLHDNQLTVQESLSSYNINIEPALNPRGGRVPIISWVQAGYASEVIDLFEPGDADDWARPTCHTKPHTYALRVQGDSMAPDFKQGMILIVEPEMDYCSGDYVIAKNGEDEATFKQYVKDGGKEYLKPVNPQYPVQELGSYKIIGVVREVIRQLR